MTDFLTPVVTGLCSLFAASLLFDVVADFIIPRGSR
jgi:hypothetical protein